MKVTHLVVFLPPALGAYVLFQHRSKVSSSLPTQDEPHTLRIWILKFTPPALSVAGATRRFSALPRGYGPSGAQALEGGVRCTSPLYSSQ